MNHPLPVRNEQQDAQSITGPIGGLSNPPVDDGMGPVVQWLYEQWLAKDAAPPAHR